MTDKAVVRQLLTEDRCPGCGGLGPNHPWQQVKPRSILKPYFLPKPYFRQNRDYLTSYLPTWTVFPAIPLVTA